MTILIFIFAISLASNWKQNWVPSMYILYLWLYCWSVTVHQKRKVYMWQRFSNITQRVKESWAGKDAKQNIALSSSACDVNLSAEVGMYDPSKKEE